MPSKFVRLKADVEIAVNLENISHIVKSDHVLFVHFIGGSDPLPLTKDVADAFWRCIKGSSLGIASYAKNQELDIPVNDQKPQNREEVCASTLMNS